MKPSKLFRESIEAIELGLTLSEERNEIDYHRDGVTIYSNKGDSFCSRYVYSIDLISSSFTHYSNFIEIKRLNANSLDVTVNFNISYDTKRMIKDYNNVTNALFIKDRNFIDDNTPLFHVKDMKTLIQNGIFNKIIIALIEDMNKKDS